MKIACLQFDPKLGAVKKNIARANELLEGKNKGDFDILVLPELAFSGYNFPSYASILDYLERPGRGPSSSWAKETAEKFGCVVAVGYPERESAISWPIPPEKSYPEIEPEYSQTEFNYNSVVVFSPSGQLIANYRKSFLYYAEATWAREGRGFSVTALDGLPLLDTLNHDTTDANNLMVKAHARVTLGICMDINPKNFEAENSLKYEFASHAVECCADLVSLSMAWSSFTLTADDLKGASGRKPDMDTWVYWFERFLPVLTKAENDVLFIMANRCGIDRGAHNRHGALCKVYDPKVVGFVEAVRAGLEYDSPEQWETFKRTLTYFSVGGLTYRQMRERIMKAFSETNHNSRSSIVQLFKWLVAPDHQPGFVGAEDLPSSFVEKGTDNAKLMAQICGVIESGKGIIAPDVVYVGSSMVWTASKGSITVHGFLGKGEEGCLVVDTLERSKSELHFRMGQNEEAN